MATDFQGVVTRANPLPVLPIQETGNTPLEVGQKGAVSTDNSTTSQLGNAGIFTGTWEDTLDYGTIVVGITTDQDSATDGLAIEYSSDGINKMQDDVFTIAANTGKVFTFTPANRYYRVKYTNGTTTTTTLNIQTILRKLAIKPSSHRIQDSIVEDDDAELVKAVLTGKANGTYKNVNTTVDGDLKISNNSSGLAIAKGDVTGTSFIHKFGKAPDFDTGDGLVTIWDGADDAHIGQMNYVYSTTAIIDSISSDNNGDTQDIEIQGLDTNYDLVTQTITITGQTRKALDTNLLRVFRMKNVSSTDNAGHIYCYENTALTTGTPTDSTKVRAVMQPGNNQTLMAVYTIPNGYTGYMRDWYASTAGANKNSNYGIEVRARPLGQVFQLKHDNAISDNGTSAYKHEYVEPEVFTEKTDIEMRCSVLAGGATGAAVSGGFDIVLIQN